MEQERYILKIDGKKFYFKNQMEMERFKQVYQFIRGLKARKSKMKKFEWIDDLCKDLEAEFIFY
ncbi:MAG: hypothetical protein SV062_07670 [Thermodesulfobacteriota bacterium]|nr:hypothetical protein [Thermodesulfobacteriota bacterium]